MKRIFAAALAVLAVAVSTASVADQQSDAKAFTDGLNQISMTCQDLTASLDTQNTLAEMRGQPSDSATFDDERKKLDACEADAKTKGTELYRPFVAKTKNAQIKSDAKDVFASWLAYVLVIRRGNGPETAEWTQLKHAESVLEVDALTN